MEFIKAHKFTVAAAAVALVVIYYYFSGSSASASTSPGSNIYDVQAAAAAHDNQLNAQLQIASLSASTQLQEAQLAADASKFTTGAQQSVALAQINATQETTDTANTLAANVAQRQIQGQTDVASINANENIQNTKAMTDALVQQISANEKVTMNSIDTSRAETIAAIQGQTAAAQQSQGCSGFFSCLFG